MTRGQEVIRPDFARDDNVKNIKTTFTTLYDSINVMYTNAEANRLKQRALDALEDAAMYAVKAMTA
jgi:hypothetical protein